MKKKQLEEKKLRIQQKRPEICFFETAVASKGRFRQICIKCKRVTYSNDYILITRCKKGEDKADSITKIKNFSKAVKQHIKTGQKKCTQEQIDKRYSICEGCPFFKDKTCTKCGCNVNKELKLLNKLALADQECPVGKWGKE